MNPYIGPPLGIKSTHYYDQRFLMVDSNVSRSKKLPNSQFLRKSKDNVISSMGKHTYGNKNDDKNYLLIIYNQNIHGLKGKINEFMLSLLDEMPHLICLSEHHLKYREIDIAHFPTYKLGAKYCRTTKIGRSLYIHP
jgi:hypothetical protein